MFYQILFFIAIAKCVVPSNGRCPSQLTPGEHLVTLNVGGRDREVYVMVPPGLTAKEVRPAIVMWHGCGSSPEKFEMESLMNEHASRRGWFNVYPKGTTTDPDGGRLGWNAGLSTCSTGGLVNDVDFARAVVLWLLETLCVDETRIFAAGFSNGASMTFNLTCSMPEAFAAFAFTGATMPTSLYPAACGLSSENVRPVLGICGGDDGCGPSIGKWFTEYAAASKCTDAAVFSKPSATTSCGAHARCGAGGDAALEYCRIEGLGHCWSGNDCCDARCTGQNPANIDMSAKVLDFFEAVRPRPNGQILASRDVGSKQV